MSKCMVRSDGRAIKVSKTEAEDLHEKGLARYISKNEYRRLTAPAPIAIPQLGPIKRAS